MSERRRRGALWIGILALTLSLFIPKGHETPPDGATVVAFLYGKPGAITVRLAGDVPHPGVYRVAVSSTVDELISSVAPSLKPRVNRDAPATPLGDGDVVIISRYREQLLTVAITSMPTRERLVLGVSLDPARMTAADWGALPGIGPALTGRIMTFARQRGGIHALDELRGVDGIGVRTIEKLRPLFHGGREIHDL